MTKTKNNEGSPRYDATIKAIIGKRAEQQDSARQGRVLLADGREALLIIVADGMGGAVGGQIASSAAVEAFSKCFAAERTSPKAERLRGALDAANAAIAQEIERDSRLNGMGSTLVAVIVDGSRIDWVSVGDSLLLSARGGGLERLNDDHSMASVLDRSASRGEISRDEAAQSPQRNMLRSALTGGEIALIDIGGTTIEPGTLLIAATDGILTLPYPNIAKIAGEAQNADAAAAGLIDAVSADMPSDQDNLTIAALLMRDGSMPPPVAEVERRRPSAWMIGVLALGLAIFLSAVIALAIALLDPGEAPKAKPKSVVTKEVKERHKPKPSDADSGPVPVRKEKVIPLPSLNPKPVEKPKPKPKPPAEKPKPAAETPKPKPAEPTPTDPKPSPAPAPVDKPATPPAAKPSKDAAPGPVSDRSSQHGGYSL